MALRFFTRGPGEEPQPPASGEIGESGGVEAEAEPRRPAASRRRGGQQALEAPQGEVQPADFPESEGARRRRRRRPRPARAAEQAPEEASAPAEPVPIATPAAADTGAPDAQPATRRRRRKSTAQAAPAETTPPAAAPVPGPTPAAPARGGGASRREADPFEALQALVARQNVILESFATKELSVLRAVERSIQTLAQRTGGELLPASMSGAAPRVGIFVDVPNIMYAAERLSVVIDFGKLLRQLTQGRSLVRASAYAPISDDPHVAIESQKFVAPFVDHGYRIVTKPLKRFADGSVKANFDVELAMDVLMMSDRLDIVSLVSGDGDFRRLCELVASKGVRVEVVAFGQSTAAELRTVADEYVDISARLDDLTP